MSAVRKSIATSKSDFSRRENYIEIKKRSVGGHCVFLCAIYCNAATCAKQLLFVVYYYLKGAGWVCLFITGRDIKCCAALRFLNLW